MFTSSIVIQRHVEDLQLGVESYQKKLNLTKPDTYRSNLKLKEAYTAYSNPRGFIYQNKDKQNRLMRIDELHKFSDDTLNDVRTALDDHLNDGNPSGANIKQAHGRRSDNENLLCLMNLIHMCEMILTLAGNLVKEILLKLNLPDHMSILTDSQVTPTKHERMTKPYSSYRFSTNGFNAGHLKMEVKFGGYAAAPAPQPQPGYAPNHFTDLASIFSSVYLQQPPQDPQQYMDIGASTHMNYNSVPRLTIDNWASISFDPFSFTEKDFKTGAFLQRCNSHGELYPVVPSSSPFLPLATTLSALSFDTWNRRLGHPGQHKLAPRSTAYVYLGPSSDHQGSRCLDLITRRVIISHHVTFDEDHFPYSSFYFTPSTSEYDVFGYEDTPLVKPGLAHLPPFADPRDTFQTPRRESSGLAPGLSHVEPTIPPISAFTSVPPSLPTHPMAMCDPIWKKAMESKMPALLSNNIWKLVPRPSHANIVGCRWLYRHKFDSLARPTHMCRLQKALYGLKQAPRAWYHRFAVFIASIGFVSSKSDNSLFTYHRVCDTIYLLLYVDDIILTASFASLVHLVISRLSIEPAMTEFEKLSYFLGIVATRPTHMCRLQKALYGLKQAPRAWYHRFAVFIASIGFVSSKSDNSLFTYHRVCDTIYLLLYVDDIILTASFASLVHLVISRLSIEPAMTEFEKLSYFLGIVASRSSSGLFLS
nr:hypothetical protein [Tanacetum cinerariifolium]